MSRSICPFLGGIRFQESKDKDQRSFTKIVGVCTVYTDVAKTGLEMDPDLFECVDMKLGIGMRTEPCGRACNGDFLKSCKIHPLEKNTVIAEKMDE